MGPARLRCASVLAHRSTVLVPRTLHRSATWELRASAALRCSLTGPPSSFLGRCTALPHGRCAPPLRFGARSPVHRPRSSDAAPLCHMGAARLRCASVLAHRSTVLVPRTLHRSATWELRASAALRCSLTGPPSSFLGRCTALPHGSCAPPLRFGARSPVHRPRSSDAAPPCHMGAARLRCASVLAHRSTVLVPRTLHRPATWELRASAALRCSLTGPPSSFLGRGTALPHGSCAPPLRFGARSPVRQLVLEHLAGGVAWQLVEKGDAARHLVVGQPL